ncbi:Ethanolamine kinase [Bertholletia excelsa]
MAVKTNGSILTEELMKLLISLWGDVIDKNMLKVTHLSGAMTNRVYKISWPSNTENVTQTVLLRIYGEAVELFFDRDQEIQTFESISRNGQGPRLLGQLQDGRVEEFIHARTLSASDLRDPGVSALIAAKLREFHNLDMPGQKNIVLWKRIRNWLSKAKNVCSSKDAREFRLDDLEQEINLLEKGLSRDSQEIGFCHNDLQYGNIMINEKTRSITIIDYEYASYNPVAYDLANHFCEMAANYHTEKPHVLNYDVCPGKQYPSLWERRRFARIYLCSGGKHPSETEVEQLVEDADKYTLASHLFWGLWGIISGSVNGSIEFDYKEYARQRFQQYWLRKPQLLYENGST